MEALDLKEEGVDGVQNLEGVDGVAIQVEQEFQLRSHQ